MCTSPPPDAAKHLSWHQRFNWNDVQPVEIKALNRVAKPVEAGLTFPLTGLIMCRSDGEHPTRPPAPLGPSPCGKSQWQDLKGAEGNVKYGCYNVREWPAGRRSCGGEGGLMSGLITSTHILLKRRQQNCLLDPFQTCKRPERIIPISRQRYGTDRWQTEVQQQWSRQALA